MNSGFSSLRARKIAVARARSPMYWRSRRRASTSSIVVGAAASFTCTRVPSGVPLLIECGVVNGGGGVEVAALLHERLPRSTRDRAGDGFRLAVRRVWRDQGPARTQHLAASVA